jgi:hypothetical protein
MYQGDLRDVPGASVHRKTDADVEEDVDIDEDDVEEFGEVQFDEGELEVYRSGDQEGLGVLLMYK